MARTLEELVALARTMPKGCRSTSPAYARLWAYAEVRAKDGASGRQIVKELIKLKEVKPDKEAAVVAALYRHLRKISQASYLA